MKKYFLIGMVGLMGFGELAAQEAENMYWQGYVEGEYVQMGLPKGGVLQSLLVQRGDQIKAGDLLFKLEQGREAAIRLQAEAGLEQAEATLNNLLKGSRDPEIRAIEAQLEQANASLDLSKINLERQKELRKTGASSERNFDNAVANNNFSLAQVSEIEAQLEIAKLEARGDEILAAQAEVKRASAQIAEADWNLWQRQANAPANSLVFDTYYRVGEFVPGGRPVLSLLPPENIKVRFFVKETELGALQHGQVVSINCDGCQQGLRANVTYISPEAEFTPPIIYSEDVRDKLVFMVEAILEDKSIRLNPGQPVDVRK